MVNIDQKLTVPTGEKPVRVLSVFLKRGSRYPKHGVGPEKEDGQ